MKLVDLSSNLLKYMAEQYKINRQKYFVFETFKAMYPNFDDDFISDALYLLQSDGLVSVQPADNIAYRTLLNVRAIRSAEEDTLLKKGYHVMKEIRSWF